MHGPYFFILQRVQPLKGILPNPAFCLTCELLSSSLRRNLYTRRPAALGLVGTAVKDTSYLQVQRFLVSCADWHTLSLCTQKFACRVTRFVLCLATTCLLCAVRLVNFGPT